MIIKEFADEIQDLVSFLSENTWYYLNDSNPTRESILDKYENKVFTGEGIKSFWIISDENKKIGFIRIYDINDGTPLIDIRLAKDSKGLGIGTNAIKWISQFIFETYTNIDRIEGNTRQDNYSMRSVFEKCGYVKEAHYRKAWKDKSGIEYDAIGYALLRDDWKECNQTPVLWDDFKRNKE